ncbi:MAG: hypothetical protein ACLP1X_21400 [Polyangiaceae bacterium]
MTLPAEPRPLAAYPGTVKPRLHEAALAVTLDGTVLVSMAHLVPKGDPRRLLARALREGQDVFVGVALTDQESAFVLARLDNAGAEAAARISADRQRRRRAKERIKRRSAT